MIDAVECLDRKGNPLAAIAFRRRLFQLAPGDSQNLFQLSTALSTIGEIDEAIVCCRKFLEKELSSTPAIANYLMYLNYSDRLLPSEVSSEHFRLGMRYFSPSVNSSPLSTKKSNQKIRIGFLSADFIAHPVGKIAIPIIASLPRHSLEVIVLHDSVQKDNLTRRVEEACDGYQCVAGWTDDELSDHIRQKELDVLVDLGGFTGGGNRPRVFANRAAQVQVSYLGYPFTSAFHTIDFRITDEVVDPPGFVEGLYGEQLAYIPGGHFAWRPYEESSRVVSRDSNSFQVLGCFNNPIKLSRSCLETWTNILRRVPKAVIVFKYGNRYRDAVVRDRILSIFSSRGVSPDRLRFQHDSIPLFAHLQQMADVDLALDSFPYQGTMTSLECLSVGTPILAKAGRYYPHRSTSAMLEKIGMHELTTDSVEEYEEVAVQLLNSMELLKEMRQLVRSQFYASELVNVEGFALRFDQMIQSIVYK